ncbi:MAG: ankyrin repeat domain-containing protein [Gammaproteobacteria bacterium]|nr:ankyrin repeat domain-containing protein [Gammaproteobacteria bacterium]
MYSTILNTLKYVAKKNRLDEERIQKEALVIRLLEENPDIRNKKDNAQQTILIWAASLGNIKVVQYLISKEVNLDASTDAPGHTDHGKTALHWAYSRGHYDIIYALLNAGAADTGISNTFQSKWKKKVIISNEHLIHQATKNAQFTLVEALINRYPTLLQQKNGNGETPLLLAARYAFNRGIHYFILKGADINVATHRPGHSDHGKTTLHWVYDLGRYGTLKMLMKRNVVDTPVNGDYVFDKAVKDGRLDIIQLFVDLNPNFWSDNYQSINKWIALASGHMIEDCFNNDAKTWEPGWPDIVEYLTLGAESNGITLDHASKTAMNSSQETLNRSHTTPSVLDLISKGISLDVPINNPSHPGHGKTAVQLAYDRKHYIEMGLLLDAGAKVDGLTCKRLIYEATKHAGIDTVERLFDEYPNLKYHQYNWLGNRLGSTPMHLVCNRHEFTSAQFPLIFAARQGYKNIVRHLIANGENINATVNNRNDLKVHGKTVLRLTYEARQYTTVIILLDAGAKDLPFKKEYLIHLAALDGRLDIVKLLLKKNPTLLNQTDQYGKTPLDWAIEGGRASVSEILIRSKAIANVYTEQVANYLSTSNLRALSVFRAPPVTENIPDTLMSKHDNTAKPNKVNNRRTQRQQMCRHTNAFPGDFQPKWLRNMSNKSVQNKEENKDVSHPSLGS